MWLNLLHILFQKIGAETQEIELKANMGTHLANLTEMISDLEKAINEKDAIIKELMEAIRELTKKWEEQAGKQQEAVEMDIQLASTSDQYCQQEEKKTQTPRERRQQKTIHEGDSLNNWSRTTWQ